MKLYPGCLAQKHYRENGYMAQPTATAISKKKTNDHAAYFARSTGRRRPSIPKAMEIISAKSSIACKCEK